MCVVNCGWLGWFGKSRKMFLKGINFRKIYVLLSVVDLGDFQSSLKYFSKCSNFENMCGVISGWLGWLARMDFCEVQFSKMYVSQLLLKWVTCPNLATRFQVALSKAYTSHLPVDLDDLPILARIFLEMSNFQNMCVVNCGWLGWLVESWKNVP